MSQGTMTYTEEKIAKNKAKFAVGEVVGVQSPDMLNWSAPEYSKVVVVRHTKNRIIVQFLNSNDEKISKEGSYNAETLDAIGSSHHTNRLVNWHNDLRLETDIKELNKELSETRRQLGSNVGRHDYEDIKELAEKITNIISEIEEKLPRYNLAVGYSGGL